MEGYSNVYNKLELTEIVSTKVLLTKGKSNFDFEETMIIPKAIICSQYYFVVSIPI